MTVLIVAGVAVALTLAALLGLALGRAASRSTLLERSVPGGAA